MRFQGYLVERNSMHGEAASQSPLLPAPLLPAPLLPAPLLPVTALSVDDRMTQFRISAHQRGCDRRVRRIGLGPEFQCDISNLWHGRDKSLVAPKSLKHHV